MSSRQYLFRTPIQQVYGIQAHNNEVFIKRDDLLPFSFGGNKVRIARAFISDMKSRGCNAMVMYGDRHSNLCRVLANMCYIENYPCVMVVTNANSDDQSVSFNQTLISMFDVKVIPCEKDRIADAVDVGMEGLSSKGYKPYYIYGSRLGTGNEGVAARAYAEAYHEITEQEQRLGFSFDRIVLPYGTGSTQGGLVAGELESGDRRPIDGISISSRSEERAFAILRKTVFSYFESKGELPPSTQLVNDTLHLHCEYNLGGYGIFNQEVLNVSNLLLKENGIPFDPIYTAKAFSGMLRLLKDRNIRGERILFVHTGGLPLYFDSLREGERQC